jgi:hypothetical protein
MIEAMRGAPPTDAPTDRGPAGAVDSNIVPVTDKPEDEDVPYQIKRHLHEETPREDIEHGHPVEIMQRPAMGFPGVRVPAAKSDSQSDTKSPAPTSTPGAKPGAEPSRATPGSSSLIGRFLDEHELPAALRAATAAAKLSREQSKPEINDADVPGLSHSDSRIANEARRIYASPEMAALESAHEAHRHMVVVIGGQGVQYDPNYSYGSGITMGDHFVIGPKAFDSREETGRTIAHELYRLRSGQMTGEIPAGSYAADATQAAFDFANRVGSYVVGGRK